MFLIWRNEEPEYKNKIFPDRDPHVEDPMRNEYCFLSMLKFRYFYEKEIVHSLKEVHEKGKRRTEVVGFCHRSKEYRV